MQKLDMPEMTSEDNDVLFPDQFEGINCSKNANTETYWSNVTKRPFLIVYTTPLDYLMASKDAGFEQDRKADMNRLQCTFFFQSEGFKSWY